MSYHPKALPHTDVFHDQEEMLCLIELVSQAFIKLSSSFAEIKSFKEKRNIKSIVSKNIKAGIIFFISAPYIISISIFFSGFSGNTIECFSTSSSTSNVEKSLENLL